MSSVFIAGIAGSNPIEELDVCVLCWLYVVKLAASVMSGSLVERIPTGCVCVCVNECGLETSTILQLRLYFSCFAT